MSLPTDNPHHAPFNSEVEDSPGRVTGHPRELPRGLGERIRARRLEIGISQAELARRAGVSTAYVSRLERSLKVHPSMDVARRLAAGLSAASPWFLVTEAMGKPHGPHGLIEFLGESQLSPEEQAAFEVLADAAPASIPAVEWRFVYEALRRSVWRRD